MLLFLLIGQTLACDELLLLITKRIVLIRFITELFCSANLACRPHGCRHIWKLSGSPCPCWMSSGWVGATLKVRRPPFLQLQDALSRNPLGFHKHPTSCTPAPASSSSCQLGSAEALRSHTGRILGGGGITIIDSQAAAKYQLGGFSVRGTSAHLQVCLAPSCFPEEQKLDQSLGCRLFICACSPPHSSGAAAVRAA